MALTAAFHGSGHTRPAMVLMVLRMWVLRLPAGSVLGFVLGWGSAGVYWGMVLGNAAATLLAYLMFRQGSWQQGVISPVRKAQSAPALETVGKEVTPES